MAATDTATRISDPEGISAAGLTVLFESMKPVVDVVFVHGFTGCPIRTWTHNTATVPLDEIEKPSSKIRKILAHRFASNESITANRKLYWPLDLVPDTLPDARVLTYGYDTHVRHVAAGPVSEIMLHAHAGDFLAALESRRRQEPSRPLLFVAHSLGGLLIKEALRQSRGYESQPDFRAIFEATIGIIFFGTPHEGADPRTSVRQAVTLLAKGLGFRLNNKIVNALVPSAEHQLQLRDEFNRMIDDQGWIIHSFQEQYALPGLFRKKVVEDSSSCVKHPHAEITEHIASDHRDMCRFSGPLDREYQKVASALQRIVATAARRSSRSHIARNSGSAPNSALADDRPENYFQKLVSSLYFPQIDDRYATIERAHSKACHWLLNVPEYISWTNATALSQNNFLWIKGKPGSGKSTLMKFARSQVKQVASEAIAIHFFFNARGVELERSTLGLYRSILFQLFHVAPELQAVCATAGVARDGAGSGLLGNINALKEIFSSALRGIRGRPVVCYIDALDEGDEDKVRDMISFFLNAQEEAAESGVHLRVCLSSRHYPHISIRKGLSFDLERQEQHYQDIAAYINSELYIGDEGRAAEIRQQVQDKASGIFLWTVLVVRILNREYDRGNMAALRRRLNEIPAGLYNLFEDIFTRDVDNLENLWICTQWVLFAKEPLTREELYFAIISGTAPSEIKAWDRKEVSVSDMGRYILSASKGLTYIASKSHTVHFIHESVRDFLILENGLGKLWPQFLNNFRGSSQERLRQCCEAYLHSITGVDQVDSTMRRPIVPMPTPRTSYPFLEYSICNVFYHADLAQASGKPQDAFLQEFDLVRWIILSNTLQRYPMRRHTREATMLYILAERDAHHLVNICPHLTLDYDAPTTETYGFPIFAALAYSNDATVRLLLSAMTGLDSCECGVATPPVNAYTCPRYIGGFGPFLGDNPERMALLAKHEGAKHHSGAYSLDPGRDSVHSNLQTIVEMGDSALLHALLRQKYPHRTADETDAGKLPVLNEAVMCSDKALFPLLLFHGYVPQEPLITNSFVAAHAATRGLGSIIRLMIDADLDHSRSLAPSSLDPEAATLWSFVKVSAGWNGGVALTYAARSGYLEVIELLLDSGSVDPNGAPLLTLGKVPLCEAAKNAQVDTVRFLLCIDGIDPYGKSSDGSSLKVAIDQRINMPDRTRGQIVGLLRDAIYADLSRSRMCPPRS